jgi:type II secretory pathway component PulL
MKLIITDLEEETQSNVLRLKYTMLIALFLIFSLNSCVATSHIQKEVQKKDYVHPLIPQNEIENEN